MSIRDLLVFAAIFGSLPFILRRPYIGVLVWSWLAYMNPHRLTWGPAFEFPFSQIVALVTLISFFLTRDRNSIQISGTIIVWVVFFCWTAFTTLFALDSAGAAIEWDRWWKVQLFSVITLMLMQSRERINYLIWVIVVSIGFFGVKGGIFTLTTGGYYHVLGPPLSFIGGSTSIALALLMVLPLMRYLQVEAESRWIRWGLIASMALTTVAIIGSQSRGALLGLAGMATYLVFKSGKKIAIGFAVVVMSAVIVYFMPQQWFDRMDTIANYEEDGSAMGRINAWWFAFNLAADRPLTGGGFNTFTYELFEVYAPDPHDFHDAHSIYFEVLAEHGFVGLALFLGLGVAAYRTGTWIIRNSRDRPDAQWAKNLAAMLQTSLAGYAICGAFLGLAYFDLYYHLICLMLLTRWCLELQMAQSVEMTPALQNA